MSKQRLIPISEGELFKIMVNNNKYKIIVKELRKLDFDGNGFVTSCEFNQLFHECYKHELAGKSMLKVFRPFASIQNKNLIDYKRFNEYLQSRLATILPERKNVVAEAPKFILNKDLAREAGEG